MKFRLKPILLVYFKEIKSQIRDTQSLIYIIILPISLYPLIFWATNQIMLIYGGFFKKHIANVYLTGNPPIVQEFKSFIQNNYAEKIKLVRKKSDSHIIVKLPYKVVNDKEICYEFEIRYNSAMDASKASLDIVKDALETFRMFIIASTVRKNTEYKNYFETKIYENNIATQEKLGSYVISMILPFLTIIMIAMGSLYPAMDIIIGERERNTFETTLILPIERTELLISKLLVVTTTGLISAMLNIFSFSLLASHLISISESEKINFKFPLKYLPIILISMGLIALFFAAVLLILTSVARNYKEGQSFVTPFWIISFQPAIVVSIPGIELNNLTIWIPISNTALLLKSIFEGTIENMLVVKVLIINILYLIPFLLLSFWIYHKEELLTYNFTGSFLRDFKAILGIGRKKYWK